VLEDGRPKALQIETAAVLVNNSPLHYLLGDEDFERALDVLREGWLLQSQESPGFPHYDNDLRALPSRLRDLLQHKTRVGRRRGERSTSNESGDAGVGVAPEVTRSEMSVIEGWHANTSCVQVSFVSKLTRKATLYTTPLINDFPINAWIFLPPSVLDADLHTPSSPAHLSDQDQHPLPPHQTSRDPHLSFVVHIATPMRVEIDRLQLLFLMRLKDSLTAFKSSLMKFLDPEVMSPQLKDSLEARKSGADSSKMGISGCVAVSCVEVSLLLPSLYTSRPSRATNTDSPLSDDDNLCQVRQGSEPSVGSLGLQLDASSAYPDPHSAQHSESSSQTSLPTAEPDQNGPGSLPAATYSLLGARRGSVESLSTEGRTPSPSGSLASLPVILESNVAEPRVSPLPQSLPLGPVRSVSAIEIHLPNTIKDKLSNGASYSPSLNVSASSTSASSPPSTISNSPEVSITLVMPSLTSSGIPDSVVETSLTTATLSPKSSPSKLSEDEFVLVQSSKLAQPSASPASLPTSATSDTLRVTSTTVGQSDHTSSNELTASANFPVSSESSQLSLTSQRQLKSPAPLRTVPQFILHAEVRHVCALPNIEGGAITARVSVDSVSVRELTVQEYEGKKEMAKKRKRNIPAASQAPSIKARLEVGNQVKRFYPEDCTHAHDIIVIATAEDLDLALLLPNIAILKDFFDDEYLADKPLPLHLKVSGTRAVLMESLDHGADHMQSMSVGVAQLEVHRGHELAPGLDIFRQAVDRSVKNLNISSL